METYTVPNGEKVDWHSLRTFTESADWKFFALSYDLKNDIDGLTSDNPDHLKWPLIEVVKPEHVITIDKKGQVEVHSDYPIRLLEEISNLSKDNSEVSIDYALPEYSMSKEEHTSKVEYIKSQIALGNLYEMNLCMEIVLPEFRCSNLGQLYAKLSDASPTPFSCYVKSGDKHLICASPERYIARKHGRIYSQPIKGTSRRYVDEHKNKVSRLHLANSLKERAEHIMIVDLVRNDLSKVSHPGTVEVDELFGIYGYRQVNQMISTISGKLEENTSWVDCIRASYPMGSMTGAPKHITMEFIDDIETATRGWYSGSMGYIDPNGDFDSNVVIRSLMVDAGKSLAKYAVGGAITFDSDPEAEYEECLLKSEALRQVLG
jgi:para-aminobenzoate synthetase component 1